MPNAGTGIGFVRGLKQLATYLPLNRQAVLVRRLLPRRAWYRAALTVARAQGRLVARMGGNGALTTELMLDHWLRELSFAGYFAIPYRVRGLEVCKTPGPKLYTWTHLPLTEVPLRVGLEQGCAAPAVVSDVGKVVGESEFLVFGWPERIEALPVNDQLLSRVKGTLRAGKSVVFLADPHLGGAMSEVPLRIAGRLHVPMVLQWADLQPDGHIEVTFRLAPRPLNENDEAVEENLRFLREARNRRLTALGWGALPPE